VCGRAVAHSLLPSAVLKIVPCPLPSPHVLSSPLSCPLLSRPLLSSRVVSCRVVSCRVVSCRVVSCRVVSCRLFGDLWISVPRSLVLIHCGCVAMCSKIPPWKRKK
jgi:hypothetical protein